jgi:hypothetical protein
MLNREQKRKLLGYSKEQLVAIIEENERVKGVLTLQVKEAQNVAAQQTKESLSTVFSVMTKALRDTIANGTYTKEEEDLLVQTYLDNLKFEMNKTRGGEEDGTGIQQ